MSEKKASGKQSNEKQNQPDGNRILTPHDESYIDRYKVAISTGLHSALGYRLSRVKSWDCLPKLYGYIENALTSDESLNIIRFFYNAHPKADPEFWKLKPGVVDSFGIVSKHGDFLLALSRCVLYPHVNIAANITNRIMRIAENPTDDVFELLFLFMQLAQQVEDAKTKDIVWLIMVSHMIRLHTTIYSSECPTLWIKNLRNAVAHSQILLVGPMITAYNLTQNGEKNWEMSIEVNFLRQALLLMFHDIWYIYNRIDMSVKSFRYYLYGIEKLPSSITGVEVPGSTETAAVIAVPAPAPAPAPAPFVEKKNESD